MTEHSSSNDPIPNALRLRVLACLVFMSSFVLVSSIVAGNWPKLDRATAGARWAHPELSDANYQEWIEFVQPTEEDLEWRKVRWHVELADAQEEARRLQRPILLWTMNGHPCGET